MIEPSLKLKWEKELSSSKQSLKKQVKVLRPKGKSLKRKELICKKITKSKLLSWKLLTCLKPKQLNLIINLKLHN